MVLLEETDPRHCAAPAFGDHLADCPADCRASFGSTAIKWMRERAYRAVTLAKLLARGLGAAAPRLRLILLPCRSAFPC